MALTSTRATAPLVERVDPGGTALLVVDVQNDFCHADGLFGRRGYDLSAMSSMARRLRRLVNAARHSDVLVAFVRATYDEAVLGDPIAENYRQRQLTGCA
jgi:nicotinamidase-related amidase